jgi:hypothetical protein
MASAGSTLANEWLLLKAACASDLPPGTIRSIVSAPIQWNTLFTLAESHGVKPLLYRMLATVRDAVPVDEMPLLEASYQTNLHRSLLISLEMIRVVDQLRAIGVDVLPYKGVALAETFYGDLALRQSGDIDLLIRSQDFFRIREALGQIGYQSHWSFSEPQQRAYLNSGYECAFDSAAGKNLLEVQWAIQPRFYAVDFDMEGLFRRAARAMVAGREMAAPSPEDLFLVLSLHAAKHVWGRLIWLCDLSRIMNLPRLNWNWIGLEAEELGIVRILRTTLVLAERLLGTRIPDAAETCIPEDAEASNLAEEIQRRIVSQTGCDTESLAYFRLMLRLREKQTDRMRFLARLAFTPGPGEWAAIRLPEPLFPFYRVVRLSRLAARSVGI